MKPRRALLVLFPLYLAQGLPFGFQTTALPLFLRTHEVSLVAIGFSGVLALPWMAKVLWAPLVDRLGASHSNHYKRWIVPLQAAMTLTALGAAFLTTTLLPLLIAVFLLNLFAATQDIAVDGLAVRTLEERELGPANAIQVVGYKAGMLLGGGLLVAASTHTGWRGVFIGMAVVLGLVTLASFVFVREHEAERSETRPEERRVRDVLCSVLGATRKHGVGFLLLVATYKLGETMIDVMFKPFLVDRGFSVADIGRWLGTYGMIASLIGSGLGGVLGRIAGIERAVVLAAFLRLPALAAEFGLTLFAPSASAVISVSIAEHLLGGMLTTAMFALMMKRSERSVGATHYTLLASIEAFGKSPGSWASGAIAQRWGYETLFALGVMLSLGYGVLASVFLRKSRVTGSS